MPGLLFLAGFVLLQGVVIFVAVGCLTRKRRIAYYAALYVPSILLALIVALGSSDDWTAVMLVQTALSVMYNVYISNSKSDG
jgi:predicted permease